MKETSTIGLSAVWLLSFVVLLNDAVSQESRKADDVLGSAEASLAIGDASGAEAQLETLTSGSLSDEATAFVRQAWSLRGQVAERDGRLSNALNFYSEAIKQFESAQEQKGLELASLLCKRANVRRQLGQFQAASEDCVNAISLVEDSSSIEREQNVRLAMAACLNVFGAVERARGDFDSAQTKYESVMRIFEQEPPQNHSDVARVLSNIGINFQKKGDFGNARRKLEQALGMLEPSRPEHQLMVATFRHNLGGILESQGELEAAKEQYLASSDLLESIDRVKPHPLTATVWASLGMLELELKNPQMSVVYFEKALAARQAIFGERAANPHIALATQNLARALLELGKIDAAQEKAVSAIKSQEQIYAGRTIHPDLCKSYLLLARVSERKGDMDQALQQAKRAVEAYVEAYPKSSYPDGHGDIVEAMQVLGEYQLRAGQAAEAIESLRQSSQMGVDLAQNFLLTAAEAESRQYLSARLSTPKLLLEAMRVEKCSADEQYAAILPSRRMVQRAIAVRNRWIHENLKDTEQFSRYLSVRRRLNFVSEMQEMNQDNRAAILSELQNLTQEKESLERQLADAVDLAIDEEDEPLLSRLMQAIDHNSALLEILELSDAGTDASQKEYVVFIVTRNAVTRVHLGDAQAIDRVCTEWLSALANPSDHEVERTLARLVSDQIWNPITALLPPHVDRLYVCPDGVFAQLPWVALFDKDQNTRVIDRYTVSLLPYSQMLLEPTNSLLSEWTETLLVGDVDYGQSKWPALPGSVDELAALSSTLEKISSIHTETLRRREATLEKVCSRLPVVAVAHFATHGQFTGAAAEENLATNSADRNPLLSSGIVLAPWDASGAGQAVVSGEQIAALDLRNLQLATLSACDTGRGKLIEGDGVYGLQQAFHLAGTHSVVASRWRIDDRQTVRLMNVFYEQMLQQKLEPAQALAVAQRAFRFGNLAASTADRGASDADAPGTPPPTVDPLVGVHPFYWAAFQHSGR